MIIIQKIKRLSCILGKKQVSVFFISRKLLRKTSYRSYCFKIDYNKLVLKRYLAIMYFNFLIELVHTFWKHENFIRQHIDDNFPKNSYWNFAKYIYKVRYINLINTPQIFIDPAYFFIKDEIKSFLTPKIRIQTKEQIFLDSQNLYFYCKHRVEKVLLLISKNVWALIAQTRFSSRTKWLITEDNLNQYTDIAKPWDILLSRWNWNASNFTIPGFWKHMALYLWTGSNIIKTYKKSNIIHSSKYKKNTHYIIEATGKWINIVSLEDFALKNDYLWVSRTNFKKKKIESTIISALSHKWKWYDHLFNYHSDKNLVCSELVLKSYAPKFEWDEWINFQLEKIGINFTFPPNNFIKILQQEHTQKSPAVFPLFFIDAKEKTQKSFCVSKVWIIWKWITSKA